MFGQRWPRNTSKAFCDSKSRARANPYKDLRQATTEIGRQTDKTIDDAIALHGRGRQIHQARGIAIETHRQLQALVEHELAPPAPRLLPALPAVWSRPFQNIDTATDLVPWIWF